MPDKHLSARFDNELRVLSSHVLELGGLVEAQTRQAASALACFDEVAARRVIANEVRVNRLEIDIDRELNSAIGRRQPKGEDLRLLTAMSRTTAHLERIGDEAERVARTVDAVLARGGDHTEPARELQLAAELASGQLRKALDAFARLDTASAAAILKDDQALDREFGEFLRRITARMTQEPRAIASGVELVLAARAIERIGDHAKNIAECIIYVVQGADVRHCGTEDVERAIR
ncbi:MAG TPA: phosphate signaling complex protein PhoU [Ramlibacter sp.]|uniref:phosphate signaling complex protein PhoU n=1 Tax=Ramlibacter sp. TaxID=1917967 RepID=UPI002ED1576A